MRSISHPRGLGAPATAPQRRPASAKKITKTPTTSERTMPLLLLRSPPPHSDPDCRRGSSIRVRAQPQQQKTKLEPFPSSLDEAIRMARRATRAAIDSGEVTVAEVELPSSSLSAVMGDAEGANEMTYSALLLRDFVREWERQLGSKLRVFFPDAPELSVVTRGRGMDPNAGSKGVEPSFAETRCSLDFLCQPTALSDLGLDVRKRDPSRLLDPDGEGKRDALAVVAYPSFNVNEMIAVDDMWRAMAQRRRERRAEKDGIGGDDGAGEPPPPLVPVVIFNGELERIYSNYYPPLFYRRLHAVNRSGGILASDGSAATFYIHNFKSVSNPAVLYRCWPGPWQLLRRRRRADGSEFTVCVWSSEERPSLKKVSLELMNDPKLQ